MFEIVAAPHELLPGMPHFGLLEALNARGLRIVELLIGQRSTAVGATVAELALPRECVLCAIGRGEEVLFPRGETRLQAGDHLFAVADAQAEAYLRFILMPPQPAAPSPAPGSTVEPVRGPHGARSPGGL